jgi:hypothetical protein
VINPQLPAQQLRQQRVAQDCKRAGLAFVDFDLVVDATNRMSKRFLNCSRWQNDGEMINRIECDLRECA